MTDTTEASTDAATTEVIAPARPATRHDTEAPSRASRRPLPSLTSLRPSRAGRPRPPGPRRPRRPKLPLPNPPQRAPRDERWWIGVVVLTASLVLLSFVAHAAVFSTLQHHRAQTIAYDGLRTAMAKGTAPVNQIQVAPGQTIETGSMNPVGTPVGLLEAPAIGLSEVILEGTSGDTLRSGIGHRRDSVMPGQPGTSVVLGRQTTYGGPFSQLYRLQPGDDVRVTTGQGLHSYRVLGLRRDGEAPPPTEGATARLELQTADGLALFPSGVLTVDAELVSAPAEPGVLAMLYPALPDDERAMASNSSAWFSTFFLATLLAAAAAGSVWLWHTWGRRQAWVIAVPLIIALGVATADLAMGALPNLL